MLDYLQFSLDIEVLCLSCCFSALVLEMPNLKILDLIITFGCSAPGLFSLRQPSLSVSCTRGEAAVDVNYVQQAAVDIFFQADK